MPFKTNIMNYFKSTSESQKSSLNTRNYIVKLERCTKDLEQLNSKLNSYTCEPKTKDLFEKRNLLKNQMERLKKTNQEIINSIREKKEVMENQLERIKVQFDAFGILQSELRDYYTTAHSH